MVIFYPLHRVWITFWRQYLIPTPTQSITRGKPGKIHIYIAQEKKLCTGTSKHDLISNHNQIWAEWVGQVVWVLVGWISVAGRPGHHAHLPAAGARPHFCHRYFRSKVRHWALSSHHANQVCGLGKGEVLKPKAGLCLSWWVGLERWKMFDPEWAYEWKMFDPSSRLVPGTSPISSPAAPLVSPTTSKQMRKGSSLLSRADNCHNQQQRRTSSMCK